MPLRTKAPEPVIEVSDSTPPTVNTPSLVSKIVPVFETTLGKENVREDEATMGAEDFGLFGRGGIPTFMFRLGTIPPEKIKASENSSNPLPSLHSAPLPSRPRSKSASGSQGVDRRGDRSIASKKVNRRYVR